MLAASLVVAVLLVIDFMRVQRTAVDLEAAVARLERRAASAQSAAGQAEPQDTTAMLQLAKARIHKLNMPWDRFFSLIDSLRHEDVALLSIEPDLETGAVRIGAEARDVPAMYAYVGQLRETEVLADAVVLNHQILQQVQFRPVRFSFVGTWNHKP